EWGTGTGLWREGDWTMPRTLFRTTRFELDHLVKNIERGDIALPEIQRPFVWPNRKVRDLLDSMLRGFPVGYLLFWVTGAEVGARAIGVGDKDEAVPPVADRGWATAADERLLGVHRPQGGPGG